MTPYNHFVGLPFEYGETDCYSLMRGFYDEQFDIKLPDFARPTKFWEHGLNLYADNYLKLGFQRLQCHPHEWQYGDVFLMAVMSKIGNHVGVYVENDMILHHLWGRLSVAERYAGLTRNTTLGVYRHKDVVIDRAGTEESIEKYLSPRVLQALNELRSKNSPLVSDGS